MIQVKKASKYGKYFLFLALASLVSLMWPSKNEQSSVLPTVPQAHADVPSGDATVPASERNSDDCDSDGGDCDS